MSLSEKGVVISHMTDRLPMILRVERAAFADGMIPPVPLAGILRIGVRRSQGERDARLAHTASDQPAEA